MKVCEGCGNKIFIGKLCSECKEDAKEEKKLRTKRVSRWFEKVIKQEIKEDNK